METILEVKDLTKHFPIMRGRVAGALRAVDGVSLESRLGNFGLVGESGCGKPTLGKTMLGLYQPTAGEVRFQGQTVVCPKRQRVRYGVSCNMSTRTLEPR